MALWSNTDVDASKPKDLSDTLRNDQSVTDKAATLGVDIAEAQQTATRGKGIKTPGWVMHRTYTDSSGATRNKAEVLVAFGGNFVSGDNDTLAPEITITVQPSNQSVTAPATATFSVTATRTGSGTLTYQWQIQQEGAGAWVDISGATAASYTTGATATGDGEGATDGDKYRVIVGVENSSDTVTSSAATLTVA
jgi:hypothetical protein